LWPLATSIDELVALRRHEDAADNDVVFQHVVVVVAPLAVGADARLPLVPLKAAVFVRQQSGDLRTGGRIERGQQVIPLVKLHFCQGETHDRE
jgi:hypothetical protein